MGCCRWRRARCEAASGRAAGSLPSSGRTTSGSTGRKVAGHPLIEGRPQEGWAVLGIGLNVRPPSSRRSCRRSRRRWRWRRGADPDATRCSAPCSSLSTAALRAPTAEVLAAWRERDALLGARRGLGRRAGYGGGDHGTPGRCGSRPTRGIVQGARRRRGPPEAALGGAPARGLVAVRRRAARLLDAGSAPPPSTVSTRRSRSSAPCRLEASPARPCGGAGAPPRRRRPFGKLRSSSRASADGLRAIRAPRAAQHVLRPRACGRARRRAARRQPAVVLARGVHQPAGVARVRAARRVDEQAEQALGLRPALHRVLLVHLARVLGELPEPRSAWSRRPIGFSASACSRTLTPSRRSSRDQPPTISTASSNASASREAAISCSARMRSCELRLRWRQVTRNARRSSPVESKCSIAFARRQLFDATRAPASCAQTCCSPQCRCSTAIRQSSRSKTGARRSGRR